MLALGERKSIYILFLLRRLQSNTEVTKPSRILDLDVWAQMAILQDMVTRRLLAAGEDEKYKVVSFYKFGRSEWTEWWWMELL